MNNIKSLLKDGLIISQDQTINEAKQAIKILLSKIAKFESINSELIEALDGMHSVFLKNSTDHNYYKEDIDDLLRRAKGGL